MARKRLISNVANTRDSVSSGYPNTEKRVENTTRSEVLLTKFEVFGMGQTLSRVFNISSQSKQKLTSKRRSKIVKIYANKNRGAVETALKKSRSLTMSDSEQCEIQGKRCKGRLNSSHSRCCAYNSELR